MKRLLDKRLNCWRDKGQVDLNRTVLGVVQPTIQSAELVDGVITISGTLPTWLGDRSYLGDGDGTVPQVSATRVQMKALDALALPNLKFSNFVFTLEDSIER